MQWTAGKNAGFTEGTPWLPVNPNHTTINAEAALADPDSVFHYYQKLLKLRKELPVFAHGDFTLLEPEHPKLFVYRRSYQGKNLLVVCNFSDEETAWEPGAEWENARTLLANYPPHAGALRPWEAKMLYLE